MTFKLHLAPLLLVLAAALAVTACSTDDSSNEPQTIQAEPAAISFNSYIGSSASTRAAVNDHKTIAGVGHTAGPGVGVYAMYTNGKSYDAASTDDTNEKNFSANFMSNSHLIFYISQFDAQQTSYAWDYSPTRYWPQTKDEYVSFTAYAPYSADAKLYTKGESSFSEGGSDACYLQHNVPSDKSKMVDLLYNDGSKTANMQHYSTDGGKTWTNTSVDNAGFYTQAYYGYSNPRVLLTLKHATARIAIDLSSTALYNTTYDYKDPYTFNPDATDTKYEYTNTYIIVNKVVLLGDDKSGGNDNPTGVFYPTAYLNLETTTDDKPLWAGKVTDGKVAVTYDNTSAIETVRGEGKFNNQSKAWHNAWDKTSNKGFDSDAPRIQGNEITGWRQQKYYISGGYMQKGLHGTTEIGSAKDGYLFIIPQDFTDNNTNGDKLYCYVDYTVKYRDSDVTYNYKKYAQIKQNFEAGKAYNICIDINPGNSITFAVTTEAWPEYETYVSGTLQNGSN